MSGMATPSLPCRKPRKNNVENALWNAVGVLEEKDAILRRIASRMNARAKEGKDERGGARLRADAETARQDAEWIRDLVLSRQNRGEMQERAGRKLRKRKLRPPALQIKARNDRKAASGESIPPFGERDHVGPMILRGRRGGSENRIKEPITLPFNRKRTGLTRVVNRANRNLQRRAAFSMRQINDYRHRSFLLLFRRRGIYSK